MNDAEMEKLLEQGMSGAPPREEFREQVLRDSVLTFTRVRRTRARWRVASLAAAAVLIATVSFLLGRSSLPRAPVQTVSPIAPVARESQTVAVPRELVAWMDTARFFKQLGMEDRTAQAYERASEWLPPDASGANSAAGPVFAARTGGDEFRKMPVGPIVLVDLHKSVEGMSRVMAQVLGD